MALSWGKWLPWEFGLFLYGDIESCMSTLLCLEPKFRARTCKTVLVLDEQISLYFLCCSPSRSSTWNQHFEKGLSFCQRVSQRPVTTPLRHRLPAIQSSRALGFFFWCCSRHLYFESWDRGSANINSWCHFLDFYDEGRQKRISTSTARHAFFLMELVCCHWSH